MEQDRHHTASTGPDPEKFFLTVGRTLAHENLKEVFKTARRKRRKNGFFRPFEVVGPPFFAAPGFPWDITYKGLLSWGFFNPMGPTFECFGLVGGEGGFALIHRISHPTEIRTLCLDIVEPAQIGDEEWVAATLRRLMTSEDFSFLTSSPTFVILPPDGPLEAKWFVEPFQVALRTRVLKAEMERQIGMIKGYANPWERTQEEVKLAFEAAIDRRDWNPQSAPDLDLYTVAQWLSLVVQPDHLRAELSQFEAAWNGSQRFSGGEKNAREATTFHAQLAL